MALRDEKSKKFVKRDGTHRARLTRSGKSGPSRYSRLTVLQLAEHLVSLEDEHDGRLAELGEYEHPRTRRFAPPQMVALIKQKSAAVANDAGVLSDLVDRLIVERCTTEFSRTELARLLSIELDRPVSVRKLYRAPYAGIIDGCEEDESASLAYDSRLARVRRHTRQPRRLLIHYSLRLEKLIGGLQARCSQRLIDEAPDLKPLILPHST